ncbi:phage tail protein [Escherichia coli]|nr:phage tail protein [Escherichia coli]
MEQYVFSPSENMFYPLSLRPVYEAAGRWPEDGIVVDYVVYKVFAADAAPAGMKRGVGAEKCRSGCRYSREGTEHDAYQKFFVFTPAAADVAGAMYPEV